jgi:preprotein translocase subunit SecF
MNWHHAVETYRGHTIPHFKLVEHRRWWFTFSGVLIVLSLLGLFWRGLNYSIDFEGGAQIAYPLLVTDVTAADIVDTMGQFGRADSQVQIVSGNQVSIRTQSLTGDPKTEGLIDALAKQAGISRTDISIQDIGPTWGAEISKKAFTGLIVVLLAIALYIALRFEAKMAVGAMIALVHDVVITAGLYALVGREVTPETVIAILTILGYSLYDTVVIYDKIKENTESGALVARLGYTGVVDLSLNQVLMRSVNTSLVVLLPILSLLLFGGSTLKDFAFAMFVGVAIGAYSSIFIAAPVLTILKGREQRYRQLEARRAVREGATATAVAAPGTADAAAGTSAVAADAAATRATARQSSGPARPRSKSKKRPPAKRKRR